MKAVQLRAKVALVEPLFRHDLIQIQAMVEIAKVVGKLNDLTRFGFLNQFDGEEKSQISLEKTLLWGSAVAQGVSESLSPAFLAGQGVDVIVGSGCFQAEPDLSFVVNNRKLLARNFLLATGSVPVIPNIEGLQKTGFLTLSDIYQVLGSSEPPKSWVILGGTPQSVEIAQSLA